MTRFDPRHRSPAPRWGRLENDVPPGWGWNATPCSSTLPISHPRSAVAFGSEAHHHSSEQRSASSRSQRARPRFPHGVSYSSSSQPWRLRPRPAGSCHAMYGDAFGASRRHLAVPMKACTAARRPNVDENSWSRAWQRCAVSNVSSPTGRSISTSTFLAGVPYTSHFRVPSISALATAASGRPSGARGNIQVEARSFNREVTSELRSYARVTR